jgi:hypothetical protein
MTREPAYGSVADVPKAFVSFLQGLFTSADAPKPRDIAEALVTLIETPAGRRPDRVVVCHPFGASDVNTAVKPIQDRLIDNTGMSSLNQLKV